MSLTNALMYIFPDLDLTSAVTVRDDGEGPYIAEWNDPRKPPTQAELDAAIPLVIKSAKRTAINTERNRREQAGFPYLGKVIDSDAVSVQRITVACTTAQMAIAAGQPYEVQWACSDNSLLTLDAAGVLGMMQALGSYGLALHYYARTLKDAVDAAADPDSVDITTGWPG